MFYRILFVTVVIYRIRNVHILSWVTLGGRDKRAFRVAILTLLDSADFTATLLLRDKAGKQCCGQRFPRTQSTRKCFQIFTRKPLIIHRCSYSYLYTHGIDYFLNSILIQIGGKLSLLKPLAAQKVYQRITNFYIFRYVKISRFSYHFHICNLK